MAWVVIPTTLLPPDGRQGSVVAETGCLCSAHLMPESRGIPRELLIVGQCWNPEEAGSVITRKDCLSSRRDGPGSASEGKQEKSRSLFCGTATNICVPNFQPLFLPQISLTVCPAGWVSVISRCCSQIDSQDCPPHDQHGMSFGSALFSGF